ncbi:MAG: protein kinase, partial [Eubacteriales bacterium]
MDNENVEKSERYEEYEGFVLDDRYVLEKLIGVGGMAVVFRARDMYINNNTVAIKMLKEDVDSDTVMVKRFKNESRAESMLKHPNIVSVHDVSVKGEVKYMVMEFVFGMTL